MTLILLTMRKDRNSIIKMYGFLPRISDKRFKQTRIVPAAVIGRPVK